ncbi:RNA polymerase sigma factor [Brevibacillus daliensis]|uniref:RNA polymerase sigma factor n=1 Tax=Brevibacillus daliensis TaxID=2892995 RepID=UPI001E4521BB|nr:sigma-70 family RNA polymerase sigma factor [Brevibacillus daliensis]
MKLKIVGQEVFLKAFRYLHQYNQKIPFGAWLYKIAYNQCVDVIRKRKLARYLPFFYRDEKQNKHVDQQIEDNYFDEFVHQAMSRLSAEERNLLILRCVEEKSYQEICLILNKKSANLRKKYERTAAKFRLKGWFFCFLINYGLCQVGSIGSKVGLSFLDSQSTMAK